MSKVYVFMADGTEEVEALTPVDLLRRAGVSVTTVSVSGRDTVVSSHRVEIRTDEVFGASDYEDGDMIVLPGGMPGTTHLYENEKLKQVLTSYQKQNRYLAAICAAPSVYGRNGMLKGKKATCYPGFEKFLTGATVTEDRVVCDPPFITSRGLGTAIDFSLTLIELLEGREKAEQVAAAIQYAS